jgi:hypothetical protein
LVLLSQNTITVLVLQALLKSTYSLQITEKGHMTKIFFKLFSETAQFRALISLEIAPKKF